MSNIPGIKDTEQQILNSSFDPTYGVLAMMNLTTDGQNAIRDTSKVVATKITTSGNYVYIAKAGVGSSQSDAKWQAKRIDTSSDTDTIITWADGNANFDNVATDLTSLSYS